MPTTTKGIPYPDSSDDPDVPADMQALAQAVDALLSDSGFHPFLLMGA